MAARSIPWTQAADTLCALELSGDGQRLGENLRACADSKIAAVGILVAVLNLVLARSGREEQAMMTTLAGLVVVLMMLVRQISDLFDLIKSLFSL